MYFSHFSSVTTFPFLNQVWLIWLCVCPPEAGECQEEQVGSSVYRQQKKSTQLTQVPYLPGFLPWGTYFWSKDNVRALAELSVQEKQNNKALRPFLPSKRFYFLNGNELEWSLEVFFFKLLISREPDLYSVLISALTESDLKLFLAPICSGSLEFWHQWVKTGVCLSPSSYTFTPAWVSDRGLRNHGQIILFGGRFSKRRALFWVNVCLSTNTSPSPQMI